jgi:hypothetical protein
VRSFDAPRERPAPASISGVTLRGEPVTQDLDGLTLLVAVKSMCDGCRDFVESDLRELGGLPVVVVSATADESGEWDHARQRVIVAPRVLRELDVRWPPFYVLIDPARGRVLTEGVVFGPSQVAEEISSYLAR